MKRIVLFLTLIVLTMLNLESCNSVSIVTPKVPCTINAKHDIRYDFTVKHITSSMGACRTILSNDSLKICDNATVVYVRVKDMYSQEKWEELEKGKYYILNTNHPEINKEDENDVIRVLDIQQEDGFIKQISIDDPQTRPFNR